MPTTETIEVFICVDADGEAGVGFTPDEARTHYTDNVGALEESDGFRLVCLKVSVPRPEIATLEVDAGQAPTLAPPSEEH